MPPAPSAAPRAAYLGPQGTFSEEALLGSASSDTVTPVALETIRDAVMAVQRQTVEWSLVPIENSIEGSVTVTLDTLAGEASEVEIVGEVVLPVRHYLIAASPLELEKIETVVSHPHVPGQCARFLHGPLARARVLAASSTAEAVRLVSERKDESLAAIGTKLASKLYGCQVIAEEIQDRDDNETRFVWLARADSGAGAPRLRAHTGGTQKTSLVFWGAGADHAGWLVRCLNEFAKREINLTKIESRPMREQLGHYMFFVDLEGSLQEETLSHALTGLRGMCEQVRVLGSYPAA
ncbi:MAG TPA: prephenate dehydratase [Solirubrobacteraceae bacterium]